MRRWTCLPREDFDSTRLAIPLRDFWPWIGCQHRRKRNWTSCILLLLCNPAQGKYGELQGNQVAVLRERRCLLLQARRTISSLLPRESSGTWDINLRRLIEKHHSGRALLRVYNNRILDYTTCSSGLYSKRPAKLRQKC